MPPSLPGPLWSHWCLLLVNTAAVIYTAANTFFFLHVIFVFFSVLFVWANLDADNLCTAWVYKWSCQLLKATELTAHLKMECSGSSFLKTGLD